MRTRGQRESRKNEDRLAFRFGGTRNAASGALNRKGDVRAPNILIEHKWTGKKSTTLRADVLEKIIGEAMVENRTPVLGISMNGEDYVIMLEDDFHELYSIAYDQR